MKSTHPEWQAVLRHVPEAAALAPADPVEANDAKEALLRGPTVLTPPLSRAEYLVAAQSFGSERARKKLDNVRTGNYERRQSIARKDAHGMKKAWVVFSAIFATAAWIALLYPDSLIDPDHYPFGGDASTIVAALVGVAGLAGHVVFERRPEPRALPYSQLLFLAYAVMGAGGLAYLTYHLSDEGVWYRPAAKLGVAVSIMVVIGFIWLFRFSRKRQSIFHWVHADTPEGREMDQALREEVSRVLAARRDFDWAAFRAGSIEGVRLMVQARRIDEDDAVWMVRQILDSGPERATAS